MAIWNGAQKHQLKNKVLITAADHGWTLIELENCREDLRAQSKVVPA